VKFILDAYSGTYTDTNNRERKEEKYTEANRKRRKRKVMNE